MTWTDPVTLSTSFNTNSIPTEANFDSLFNDLLAIPHVYAGRETSEKGVQNSTTETSLYTTAPVLTGGDLGVNGSFEAFMIGRIRQGTTASISWVWKVKLGGVTLITSTQTGGGGTDAADQPWMLSVYIEAMAAQNAQKIAVVSSVAGGINAKVIPFSVAAGTVDLSANQTFDITVQMVTSGANDLCFKQVSKQRLGQN